MKVDMGTQRTISIALVLSALALGGVLYWEWDQGLRLEQELLEIRKIPASAVPAQTILPEFTLPASDSGFPELLSRQLFAVNRRAPAPVGKGIAAMKKGQFVLVGVLITPQQRSALLRDVQTNKTEAVAQVGIVRGMTVDEVESARVVLRQGTESEELILNVQAGPKGPVPARIPAVPALPRPVASAPSLPASAAPATPTTPVPASVAASEPKAQPVPPRSVAKK
jgi:type II secretory pathway component PulC